MIRSWWIKTVILLGLYVPCYCQSPNIVIVESATAVEIIEKVQREFGVSLNYVASSLPQGKFTMSISSDPAEFALLLGLAFGVDVKTISSDSYAISASSLPSRSSIRYQGVLIDRKNLIPIIGATAELESISVGTISDRKGLLSFNGIYSRYHPVKIQYLGYSTIQTTLESLQDGQIKLSPREHILADILITSTRIDKSDALTHIISEDELSLAGTDAMEKSQSVAGVYTSSESLNEMQIRGGPPDQVSMEWNGIRLFQNSLFYGRVGAVNPLMVNQVRITRNGAEADEDAAVSGAIHFNTKLANMDTSIMRAQLSGLDANVSFQKNFGDRVKIKAAMRHSLPSSLRSNVFEQYYTNSFQFGRIQDVSYFISLFDGEEYFEFVPEFSYSDFCASSEVKLHQRSKLELNYINFGNNFAYNVLNSIDDKSGLDNINLRTEGSSLRWYTDWTDRFYSDIRLSSSDYLYSSENFDDTNDRDEGYLYQKNEVEQRTTHSEIGFNLDFGKLSLGWERNNYRAVYDAFSSRPWESYVTTLDDRSGVEDAYYLNLRISDRPWYSILLGVRYSDYDLTLLGRKITEPRVHLSFFPSKHLTLHAHGGLFHQNLNKRTFSTLLNVDNRFWLLSDEGVISDNFIYVVQSAQLSAGVRYDKGPLFATLDVYTKEGINIWSSSFDFGITEDRYEFTSVSVQGLESSIGYKSGAYQVDFTYDYIKDLITTNETTTLLNSPYSQPHRVSLQQSYQYKGFLFQLKGLMATGRAYSVGRGLLTEEKDSEIFYVVDYESFFTERVKNYVRWDANIHYAIPLQSRHKVNLTLQLMNVLNRDNIVKRQYYINYRPETPELDFYDQRALPFTWNFMIDYQF